MKLSQLIFNTAIADMRGPLVKIECEYCPMSISGYESHIKQLIERHRVNTIHVGLKRESALEHAGWVFEDTNIVDGSISGLCPACSIADSEV